MATQERTCPKDGTPTRLGCVECDTPICPKCSVRTPVGLKCQEHGRGVAAAPRRQTGKIVAGLGVLVLVLGGIFVVPGLLGDDEGDPDTTIPLGPGNPENIARFALLNEEALEANLRFVATGMECGPTFVEGGGGTRMAQGQFCLVSIIVRNPTQRPATFNSRLQELTDNQNRRFGVDDRATAVHPTNETRDLTNVLVNPGNELRGVLVFDVPRDAQPQYMNVHEGPRGRGAWIRLTRPS